MSKQTLHDYIDRCSHVVGTDDSDIDVKYITKI